MACVFRQAPNPTVTGALDFLIGDGFICFGVGTGFNMETFTDQDQGKQTNQLHNFRYFSTEG